MNDTLQESEKDLLRQAGLQYTRQRALVLQILNRRSEHLDAYEVHDAVRQTGTHMSLSTVYRILQVFRDNGLIAENHLGEDHHHYESIPTKRTEVHHHAVCRLCGRVIEFNLTDATPDDTVEALRGFQIEEISISGVCSQCAEEAGHADR